MARDSRSRHGGWKRVPRPKEAGLFEEAAKTVVALESAFKAGEWRCLNYLDVLTSLCLESFMRLIGHGSEDAAKRLSQTLTVTVENFLSSCRKRPDLFRSEARKRTVWPSLFSCERDHDKSYEAIREQIQLGQGTGLNYTGKLARSVESQIARSLFTQIEAERMTPWWVEQMAPEWRKIYEEQKHQAGVQIGFSRPEAKLQIRLPFNLSGKTLPFYVAKDDPCAFRAWSESLPVLSRQRNVLERWWKRMERSFIKVYGEDFENRDEFKSYWSNVVYRGLRETEKRNAIRRDIKRKIKQAVGSIAAKQPSVINKKLI
jgi:hypothetical protein